MYLKVDCQIFKGIIDFRGAFLKLADHKIHVHIYGNVNLDYIRELQSKSKFIHYEGILSPKDLIYEISKYDIGLAFFNINEKIKFFRYYFCK